ncbi:MAG: hypothetical protein HDS31_04825 [Bacteroides sp.]|nr:hypothetical protein [Bacteroides sp.]
MKKSAMILASLLTASAAFAQGQEANPNRVLVTDKGGVTKGFVIDYIEDMSFARVDGEVLAKVTVDEVGLTSLRLTIKMTPQCRSYRLAILPAVVADQLGNDANAIRYINSLPAGDVPTLNEDFNKGQLSGVSLNSDSKYTIITIGMDEYGIESGVSRTDFDTPAPAITGNPHVEAKQLSKGLDSFSMSFAPNKDVGSYWLVAVEKGTMQAQFEQYAPMFGFSNINQLITMWGVEQKGAITNEWTGMEPNTDYEVYIAMTDVKGNYAPYEVAEASTEAMGGSGEASVKITVGAVYASDWDGQMAPTQPITYTPNDQASCYRAALFTEAVFNEDPEEVKRQLCQDPEVPILNWFQYVERTGEYMVDLNTKYVALAAAKNGNGEWGPVAEVHFTTPATVAGVNRPASGDLRERMGAMPSPLVQKGVIPSLNLKPCKITITQD